MSLSGIAIRTEMCQAGAIRAEETHRIQPWVDSAELLGAQHLRVFLQGIFLVPPGKSRESDG
jgi:hypothetical protein